MEIPHKIARLKREIDFIASHVDEDSTVLVAALNAGIIYMQGKIATIQTNNQSDADAAIEEVALPDSDEMGGQPTLDDAPETPE